MLNKMLACSLASTVELRHNNIDVHVHMQQEEHVHTLLAQHDYGQHHGEYRALSGSSEEQKPFIVAPPAARDTVIGLSSQPSQLLLQI